MEQPNQNRSRIPQAIIISATIIAIALIYNKAPTKTVQSDTVAAPSGPAVLVDGGHILPLETEKKMLATLTTDGLIDSSKLPQVTELNLLWAYGLANKNSILDNGPVADLRYGGPTNMASIGGWTVTMGSVMDHFDKHALSILTPDQQQLVEKMAKGIYRPCCGNSTYFPDCNHGMAMLGLLEFLAANGATEDQMWNAAMTANTIWFPDTYQTIAEYMSEKGMDIKKVSPEYILGSEYSSASGYAKIAAQVTKPVQRQSGGGGCSVGSDAPAQALPKQGGGGCGI